MARDSLWRLRLKYEDSLGRCDLCERQGMVGADIKLITPSEKGPPPREEQGIAFMLRCADPATCRQRREDRQRDD